MKYFILLLFFEIPILYFSQNRDISLLRSINLNRNRSLDPEFRFVTNSTMPLTLLVPAGYLTAYLLKKNDLTKKNALVVCSSILISGVITTGLKYSVNRPRPFVTYPDIEKETSAGSPSFPSGHTSSAFAVATSLSLSFPKWYVIAPSFAWASLVAYSRMDLGVHYPSDILAGALIGSGSAFLSYKLTKWYIGHKATSIQKKTRRNKSSTLLSSLN